MAYGPYTGKRARVSKSRKKKDRRKLAAARLLKEREGNVRRIGKKEWWEKRRRRSATCKCMEEIIHGRCQAAGAMRRNEIHETGRTNDTRRDVLVLILDAAASLA